MKIGRNDPCHCGSGKKYKVCHAQKDATKGDWSKIGLVVTAVVMVVAVVFATITIVSSDANTDGLVWSAEHGHWHNADGTEVTGRRTPPPPGLPPPGKVWSEEHGHWHDAE